MQISEIATPSQGAIDEAANRKPENGRTNKGRSNGHAGLKRANSAPTPKSREDELPYRDLLEACGVALYATDAEGVLTFYNDEAAQLWGRKPEIGKDMWCGSWRILRADGSVMPHDECPMAVTLREGRPLRGVEAIAERPDGSRVWFQPFPTPLFDESGELKGAVNVLVDITDRKQAEGAASYLSAIVASSDDAIASKDLNGTITSWNAGAERLFGYSAEEAVGQSIRLIIPPDRQGEEDQVLRRIRNGEAVDHFETVRRKKDGSDVFISVTISPVRDRAGTIIGASKVARDVTEQKRAEEALRESESRLSVAMAAGQMGSWEWRMADNTVSWSKALEAIHGLEPGTFAGSFEAFLADVHPEDRQNVQDTIANSIETGTHEIEYRIIPPNGQERWVLDRGQLIRDGIGTPTRMVGVRMDITARKLAEQQIAEVSAQKDEFLGIVSHELRTPITTILGNASLLHRRIDTLSAGDRETALADLAADAERMERIINNLLVLARVDSPIETELEPVLLPRVVQKVVEQKRRRLHREIVLTIDDDVPEVIGHAQYIDHILSNLLVNANKYSPKIEAVEVQVHSDGNEAIVSVLDRGAGIAAEERDSVFTAFFRSERVSSTAPGVGVGLAVCRRLIEVQHGRIWVNAREGGGSEFSFALPLYDGR